MQFHQQQLVKAKDPQPDDKPTTAKLPFYTGDMVDKSELVLQDY